MRDRHLGSSLYLIDKYLWTEDEMWWKDVGDNEEKIKNKEVRHSKVLQESRKKKEKVSFFTAFIFPYFFVIKVIHRAEIQPLSTESLLLEFAIKQSEKKKDDWSDMKILWSENKALGW